MSDSIKAPANLTFEALEKQEVQEFSKQVIVDMQLCQQIADGASPDDSIESLQARLNAMAELGKRVSDGAGKLLARHKLSKDTIKH